MNNIFYTKVKFERNLQGVEFTNKMTSKAMAEVLKLGLDACKDIGLKAESLEKLGDGVIESLVVGEKLEMDFAENLEGKGYASNDKVNVQINGDSHIEIVAQDLDLFTAYEQAKQVDKMLCNKLHFAYNDKYGFLNPDVKKVGSGLSVSFLVMLPALTKFKAINDLPKINEKLMFNIEQVDEISGIYLISTGASLGYTEKQICTLAKSYIDNIIKLEVEMCKNMFKQDPDNVLDKGERAKATINSCVKTTILEVYYLINDILIAINAGVEKDVQPSQLLKLFNCTKDINAVDEKALAKMIKTIK